MSFRIAILIRQSIALLVTAITKKYTHKTRKSNHNANMGVDHGEDAGGQVPPEFGVGDASANCPPSDFCHIDTKRSVLWSSKYAKISFRPGLCPRPRRGSSRRSPRPRSRLKRGHPHHTPPHSAPTHLPRSPCVPLRRILARSTPMNANKLVLVNKHTKHTKT